MLEQFDRHIRKESGEESQRISLGKSPCLWEQGHTRTYSVLWEYSERILLGDKMEEINQGHMWMLTIESQNNLNCHLRPVDDQNYSRKKWVFTWRFFFIYLSIYLFMAVLSLHCCAGFFPVVVNWGCPLAAESGLLIALASLAVVRGL